MLAPTATASTASASPESQYCLTAIFHPLTPAAHPGVFHSESREKCLQRAVLTVGLYCPWRVCDCGWCQEVGGVGSEARRESRRSECERVTRVG